MVSFALSHELLDLTRLTLTYLITRQLANETISSITGFISEILEAHKGISCKETVSLLSNSLKACRLFILQNWAYLKKTVFFEQIPIEVRDEIEK